MHFWRIDFDLDEKKKHRQKREQTIDTRHCYQTWEVRPAQTTAGKWVMYSIRLCFAKPKAEPNFCIQ